MWYQSSAIISKCSLSPSQSGTDQRKRGLPTDDAPRADPVNYILRSPGVKARRPPIPSRVPDAEDLLVRDAFRARVAYLETFGAGLRDAEPSLQGGAAELVSRFDAVRGKLLCLHCGSL
jgi:hypothetical protein